MKNYLQKTTAYPEVIADYAGRSVRERTGKVVPEHETYFETSPTDEICRILLCADRLFVSVSDEYRDALTDLLDGIDIAEKLRSPDFHKEILDALDLDRSGFILEPSEEFLGDIRYNVTHTLEYVCTAETFTPHPNDAVVPIRRGDDRFILDDAFADTMYCIPDGKRIAGASFFRPNTGIFADTCAMEVFTRSEYRRRGLGRSTASAATADIVSGGRCALWVCQIENTPSQKIARSLGYIPIGGELRIVK